MNIKKQFSVLSGLLTHYRSVHQFVQFKNHDQQAFAGSVSIEELTLLEALVKEANMIDGPIIEVGTLFGFTTQYIADWKDKEKMLITIDNFRWNPIGMSPDAHRAFTNRCLHYLIKNVNVKIFEGLNSEFYKSYREKPASLIFIDAGHSYEDVMVDIKFALSSGVHIICGHDYADYCPGVIRAVDEVFGEDKTIVGSLWVHKKK